jgi:HEAT repeat protein
MRRTWLRKGLWAGLAVVGGLAGLAAWQHTALETRVCLYQLARASEDARPAWVERTAARIDTTLPTLLDWLREDGGPRCAAAGAVLRRAVEGADAADPHRLALAVRCAEVYPQCSPAGQEALLELVPALLTGNDEAVHAPCTELVQRGLKHPDAGQRAGAVGLALRPELMMLDRVVPLLGDPSAEVRRAALLAVGPHPALIGDDDLLHWLHDTDPDVRRLCATSLRSRGLSEPDIRLGGLITHPEARERMKVVLELPAAQELDAAVWLNRLSHDPAPAVRACAARYGADLPNGAFAERLRQMAQGDPDGSVRQLAVEHLRLQGRPNGDSGSVILPAGGAR